MKCKISAALPHLFSDACKQISWKGAAHLHSQVGWMILAFCLFDLLTLSMNTLPNGNLSRAVELTNLHHFVFLFLPRLNQPVIWHRCCNDPAVPAHQIAQSLKSLVAGRHVYAMELTNFVNNVLPWESYTGRLSQKSPYFQGGGNWPPKTDWPPC